MKMSVMCILMVSSLIFDDTLQHVKSQVGGGADILASIQMKKKDLASFA